MEFELLYPEAGFELEASVREDYRIGLKRLRETQDPQECFQIIKYMFEALGNSHPSPDKRIEWVRDLVHGYRNLANILGKISDPKFIISGITSRYSGLLDAYEGTNPVESIESALEDLKNIAEVLKQHDVDSDGLEERLDLADEADELREKINGLESL